MEKQKKEKEFWPIHLNCPDCKKGLTIAEVCFSSSGKVCIVGMCSQCSKYAAVVDTWEHIMKYVHEQEGWAVNTGTSLIQ